MLFYQGKKDRDDVCPYCGCDRVYNDEYQMDYDGESLIFGVTKVCENNDCGHSFTDWYKAKYDGYTSSDGIFDADGNKVSD